MSIDHQNISQNIKLGSPTKTLKSPLLNHLIKLQKKKEFKRFKRLAFFLEEFHLKYAVTSSVNQRTITLNGKQVINFGSANYLGLDQHPQVLEASKKAIDSWGTHSGTSRIFSTHANMVLLENEISELLEAEETMIGHNVSQIHAGVIPALFSSSETEIFIDRFAHTSLYQASLMAKAKGAKITSVDVADLKKVLKLLSSSNKENKVLLIDGVYSMQGHIPELKELDLICTQNNTILYIDDAHGIGIFGHLGGGVAQLVELSWNNILVTGSLQKALGTYGAFISGKKEIIDYLRITSKAYIFSGTLQPSAVDGARIAIQISKSEEGKKLRQKLANNSEKIRNELIKLGFTVPEGFSPIIPVLIGDDALTLLAGRKLYDGGVYTNSVLYPAVPKNEGIIRISLSTLHSDEEIEKLILEFSNLKFYLDNLKKTPVKIFHFMKEIIKSKLLKQKYKGL